MNTMEQKRRQFLKPTRMILPLSTRMCIPTTETPKSTN